MSIMMKDIIVTKVKKKIKLRRKQKNGVSETNSKQNNGRYK